MPASDPPETRAAAASELGVTVSRRHACVRPAAITSARPRFHNSDDPARTGRSFPTPTHRWARIAAAERAASRWRRAACGTATPLRGRHPDWQHRRRRRPAHGRRLAYDAARALRVPGPHLDRRVPTRPRAPARFAATRADPRQRPTSIRRLLPRPPDRHRAAVRIASPHAKGRTKQRLLRLGEREPASPPISCPLRTTRARRGRAGRDFRTARRKRV
jgi:hypothetical protein